MWVRAGCVGVRPAGAGWGPAPRSIWLLGAAGSSALSGWGSGSEPELELPTADPTGRINRVGR